MNTDYRKTNGTCIGTRVGRGLVASLVLALCIGCHHHRGLQDGPDPPPPGGTMKVGFITVGSISDSGFNAAHEQGRLFLERTLGPAVKTTIVENIPESGEAERVMEKMVTDGNVLIFPTSYGYLDPALRVAKRHPEAVFMHCGGHKTADNLGTYNAHIHEAVCVAGAVAGRMTKSNRLGFVAAHPIPPVHWSINAFTLGARSVNPHATVTVIYTNTWSDPAIEAEAAVTLIGLGADVLTMHQDSPKTVVQTAESRGVYSVGMHADAHEFAPRGWLTGAIWDWGPFYVDVVRSVKDKTWRPNDRHLGMKDGCVRLAAFGDAVPSDVRREAEQLVTRITAGDQIVFAGPIIDRQGNERLAQGRKPDAQWMGTMDWFVEGVEGPVKGR